MVGNTLDVRRAFEAAARVIGEKEQVEITVKSITWKGDGGETAETGGTAAVRKAVQQSPDDGIYKETQPQ